MILISILLNNYIILSTIVILISCIDKSINDNNFVNAAINTGTYNNIPLINEPRLSKSVIPSLSNNQRSLPAIKIDPSGQVYTTHILKQQLANELGLPLRDLRVVDPSLPKQIQVTFTSRPKAILFCIENIKVVVQSHEALVFNPYQREVQELIPTLQQLLNHEIDNKNNIFIHTNEFKRSKTLIENDSIITSISNQLPFEHTVIEAALNVVCSNLIRQVRDISPAVTSTLNGLRAESRGLDVVQTQVDELLPLKNKLDELRKRVKEVRRAITDTLNNDEDMCMMYLTNQTINKNTPINTMNLEMLFENYLNEIEWIASEIEEIIDEVTNTEEYVVLQLDLLRNRILRFELLLSVLSFVATCGALVTGLFGMNLLNHYETNNYMFYTLFVMILAGMIGTFKAFTRYGKKEKLF